MLMAGVLGGWAASDVGIAGFEKFQTGRALFGETYGVQVFGIVFGYLMVARLNICYARYWEGVSRGVVARCPLPRPWNALIQCPLRAPPDAYVLLRSVTILR